MRWLGQVIISPNLKSDYLVIKLRLVCKHQNGSFQRGGVLTQAPRDLIPIHIRHHYIEQDQIRILIERFLQPLLSIGGCADLVSLTLKHEAYQPQCIQIVIDDEDFFAHEDIIPVSYTHLTL